MSSPYYEKSPQEALAAQQSTLTGLSQEEAASRAAKFGENKLTEGKKKSVFVVFLEQFRDLLVVILMAAAVISALSKNVESTIVIFAVLILNAVLGTVQYVKAEKSLESLKAIAADCRSAEEFKAAVQQRYPDDSGGNYLDMTAGFFFAG